MTSKMIYHNASITQIKLPKMIQIGGLQEKMSFFQIASGPILSIPIHSNTCQYDPCKVLLKKMTPSLPMSPPKSAFFGSSDWASD